MNEERRSGLDRRQSNWDQAVAMMQRDKQSALLQELDDFLEAMQSSRVHSDEFDSPEEYWSERLKEIVKRHKKGQYGSTDAK